jgi:hypothetical protein
VPTGKLDGNDDVGTHFVGDVGWNRIEHATVHQEIVVDALRWIDARYGHAGQHSRPDQPTSEHDLLSGAKVRRHERQRDSLVFNALLTRDRSNACADSRVGQDGSGRDGESKG